MQFQLPSLKIIASGQSESKTGDRSNGELNAILMLGAHGRRATRGLVSDFRNPLTTGSRGLIEAEHVDTLLQMPGERKRPGDKVDRVGAVVGGNGDSDRVAAVGHDQQDERITDRVPGIDPAITVGIGHSKARLHADANAADMGPLKVIDAVVGAVFFPLAG